MDADSLITEFLEHAKAGLSPEVYAHASDEEGYRPVTGIVFVPHENKILIQTDVD